MRIDAFLDWIAELNTDDNDYSPEFNAARRAGVMPVREYTLGDTTYVVFRSKLRLPQAVAVAQLYCKRHYDDPGLVVDADDYEWHGKFTVSLIAPYER